jgi:hypothetical protein
MTDLTLICIRETGSDVCTYAVVHSAETPRLLAHGSELGDVETLPWDVLPGIRELAAAEISAHPERHVTILATAEGTERATWHLPVAPPPVPVT